MRLGRERFHLITLQLPLWSNEAAWFENRRSSKANPQAFERDFYRRLSFTKHESTNIVHVIMSRICWRGWCPTP
jgi:hypothetical protein